MHGSRLRSILCHYLSSFHSHLLNSFYQYFIQTIFLILQFTNCSTLYYFLCPSTHLSFLWPPLLLLHLHLKNNNHRSFLPFTTRSSFHLFNILLFFIKSFAFVLSFFLGLIWLFLFLQTWVLKVSIHCPGCKRKVKKVLQSIEGSLLLF